MFLELLSRLFNRKQQSCNRDYERNVEVWLSRADVLSRMRSRKDAVRFSENRSRSRWATHRYEQMYVPPNRNIMDADAKWGRYS